MAVNPTQTGLQAETEAGHGAGLANAPVVGGTNMPMQQQQTGTGEGGRLDSTGFAGQNTGGAYGDSPAGLQQSGSVGGPPDLTGEQGASNENGTGASSNKGILGKVKAAFSTHDENGNPKPSH